MPRKLSENTPVTAIQVPTGSMSIPSVWPRSLQILQHFRADHGAWQACRMLHTFTAQLWVWDARKSDTWTFVTVPPQLSDELQARGGASSGFGSVSVEVTIGSSCWRTSVFPDKESRCFVLPIKAAIRKAEAIAAGDTVAITLKTV